MTLVKKSQQMGSFTTRTGRVEINKERRCQKVPGSNLVLSLLKLLLCFPFIQGEFRDSMLPKITPRQPPSTSLPINSSLILSPSDATHTRNN